MTKVDVFKQILRDVVSDDADVLDVLLPMVVLHTHAIALRPGVVVDDGPHPADGEVGLAPLTRTHLAELAASMWTGTARGDSDFWTNAYRQSTPFELFDDVPAELRDRAERARRAIEDHPLVNRLIPE
jgi:hypothetical protein